MRLRRLAGVKNARSVDHGDDVAQSSRGDDDV